MTIYCGHYESFAFSLDFFCIHYSIGQNAKEESSAQKIIVTTDKAIYTNNEQIWFSAFLFTNNAVVKDTATVCTLALYDPLAEKVILCKKFTIENNFATGNLLLPDALNSGRYTLIAYTNLLQNKVPISIKYYPVDIYSKNGQQPFITPLAIVDSLCTNEKIAIGYRIMATRQMPLPAEVKTTYNVNNGKTQKLNVDASMSGIIILNRPKPNQDPQILTTTSIFNTDTITGRIRLPLLDQDYFNNAGFYPEGGHLTAGAVNRIFGEYLKDSKATPAIA